MTLQSDLSRMTLRWLLVVYVREKRRRAIRRVEKRGSSGSCVVPSDWEGQTAGQAAGVPFNGPPFHWPQKNQYVLNWPRAFSAFLRTMLIYFVQQWRCVVNKTLCNWKHLLKVNTQTGTLWQVLITSTNSIADLCSLVRSHLSTYHYNISWHFGFFCRQVL